MSFYFLRSLFLPFIDINLLIRFVIRTVVREFFLWNCFLLYIFSIILSKIEEGIRGQLAADDIVVVIIRFIYSARTVNKSVPAIAL
jgi:hypothetical protein